MVELLSAVEPWERGDGDKLTPPADASARVAQVSAPSSSDPPPHLTCLSLRGLAMATFLFFAGSHPGQHLESRIRATLLQPSPAPTQANAEWVKFTKKWRYGAEQRAAIRAEIAAILGKE